MKCSQYFAFVCVIVLSVPCLAQSNSSGSSPVGVSVNERVRVDAWNWFAAPTASNTYAYTESLLRIALTQRIERWDWRVELSQPAIFDLPANAISPIAAQGQLGLGGTYYAANGKNSYPAAAFLKQAFLRYRFRGENADLRLGRFEFFGGQETQPANATIAWLQSHRIAQRLVGNFGFTNAQRSFDGIDGHYGAGTWNLTAMAGRADQGVFNMNGNPELNVDIQYLAYTRSALRQHILWRGFAIGYHDGRTGILKTDNRPLAMRNADHSNIRIGTYGGDFLTAFPAGSGQMDFLAWGALQNGDWGVQSHRAGAAALEGGYKLTSVASAPWFRVGWFRGTGDNNSTDNQHNTFFQLLPTPRVYARFPFYDLMNSTDRFLQIIDNPAKRVAVRSDLHWLQLTSSKDLWYQGGGAFDNKVFGYTGRPANGHASLASVADISANWSASNHLSVDFYYARAWGKSAIAAIYPQGPNAQFGFVQLLYRWEMPQKRK